VSLHGTGGAWLEASESAKPEPLAAAVFNSLDRKVCNTLNTVCVVESRAAELIPVVLDAIHRAGSRAGGTSKLHFTRAALRYVPDEWLAPAEIARAEGPVVENRAELIGDDELGVEWEWENSPEVTLTVTADVDEATRLFNEQSPRLVVCLVSEDVGEMEQFFLTVDAPFVGNGFTRWVDGQFALDRPELGLSNWEFGRLLGRSGVLSGDSIYTIRTRVTQTDPDLAR
jgi:glutamate-5-semialdehyde dehydrogenase